MFELSRRDEEDINKHFASIIGKAFEKSQHARSGC